MSTGAPTQHKAALVPSSQARNVVESRATPQPQAEKNEVLIKVTATAINPVDWKMRDWNIFLSEYPAVLGSDAAGVVEATAGDTAGAAFKAGHRVFFQGVIGNYDASTFQQYVVMPADLVAHTPDNITDEQAAGVSLASIAVVAGFYHESGGLDLKPRPWEQPMPSSSGPATALPGKGKAIVILGGSSSVGQYAIQLARLSGFETIVTGSSAAHHDHLRALGATDVLDRHDATPDAYAQAARARGHALGAVYDAISSKESMLEGVAVLKDAHDGATAAGLDQPTLVAVYTADDAVSKAAADARVRINTVWGIGSSDTLRPQAGAFMKGVGGPHGWLATGAYQPNRTIVVPGGLANIEAALEKNKQGVSGHKIVICPWDV